MPLVTFQTRLSELLREAQAVKQMAAQSIAAMAAGNVSANVVINMAQRLNASIVNILTPAQQHTGLAAYAAQQFGDPQFGLDARMSGLRTLLDAVIVAARATIPTSGGYVLKDTWNADGSVSVRVLTPAQTAALRAALQAVVDAIPE
jgi:hypothetical protein